MGCVLSAHAGTPPLGCRTVRCFRGHCVRVFVALRTVCETFWWLFTRPDTPHLGGAGPAGAFISWCDRECIWHVRVENNFCMPQQFLHADGERSSVSRGALAALCGGRRRRCDQCTWSRTWSAARRRESVHGRADQRCCDSLRGAVGGRCTSCRARGALRRGRYGAAVAAWCACLAAP